MGINSAMRLPDYLPRLRAYVPGKPIEEVQREFGLPHVVKLASNENPLGPSPLAIEAIVESARNAALYPDASASTLRSALAGHLGVEENRLCLGAGSDELIHYLSLLLVGHGDNIVMADPSFSRYEACATVAGGTTKKVPLDSDSKHDLDAMATAIDENTRIVWIANPNNPTGTIVSKAAMDRFLQRIPDDIAVVLDEAYYEFAKGSDTPDGADYLDRTNVVCLRTFSKTYGLAGLRVGYALASEEMIGALERIRQPFNVSVLAQVAAHASLQDQEHLANTIQVNFDGIRRLTGFLHGHGFNVPESYANFVWCDLGYPAMPICDALLRHGVIVRPGDAFGQPHCIRVSVGTSAELDEFEHALHAILQETTRV